jgi:hypothetical protein
VGPISSQGSLFRTHRKPQAPPVASRQRERAVCVAVQLEDSIRAPRLPKKAGGSFCWGEDEEKLFRQVLIQC